MLKEYSLIYICNRKKIVIEPTDDVISNLRATINKDERKIYKLHLFNKERLRNFIDNIDNKVVFINRNDEVDIHFYETKNNNSSTIGKEQYDSLVDIIELDKNDALCKNTILNLEARNFYNHYRSIKNLEEIL